MINFNNIFDAFSEIVHVSDVETQEILYMNKTAKKFFGDKIGEKCHKAIHNKKCVCDVCPFDKLTDKEFYTWIHESEDLGKIYKHRDIIIDWEGRKAHLAIAQDITDSVNRQKDLETRLEMEHFITSCIIEIHKNKPLDETINSVLAMMGKFLDAGRVYIFDYDGVTTNNTYEWCSKKAKPQIDKLQNLEANIIDRWLDDFKNQRCMILADIKTIKDTSPEEYKLLKMQNIKSLVAAPLDDNGTLIGFIGVDNVPKEKIEKSELFFTALSHFISSVMIRAQKEEQLRYMGYVDTLTNLYNRNKFIHDTDSMKENNEGRIGIVYFDLNGLKEINDKNGHNAGDETLKNLADMIVEIFGEYKCYRVGGDEFVVICSDIAESDFMKKIDTIAEHMDASDYSAAMGYSYSEAPRNIEKIVRDADEIMYKDKKFFYRNKHHSSRYRSRNDTFASLSTPERLKKLINDERFVIWFQPRFEIQSEKFCGSEALIRFFDEDDVIVSPMDFIPDMEANETIHLIDFYIFRHVCEYISGWIEAGKNVKPVSVNMSHVTMMKPNFIENIMNIWYDYNIPKELIIIEVSEEQENGGISQIVDVLCDLKKHGFKIAIDNFGSKYADLYLFADLKFDILKLDGDMVYKIETDKKTNLLSASIANICHNENIKIVAEGVENETELKLLKEIGCDEVQGYLFDKPMSWNRFEEKYLNSMD